MTLCILEKTKMENVYIQQMKIREGVTFASQYEKIRKTEVKNPTWMKGCTVWTSLHNLESMMREFQEDAAFFAQDVYESASSGTV